MTHKTGVVVLFGGRSSEHSISCATAGGVLAAIDRERYDVYPVGIAHDGSYVLEVDDPSRYALDPEHLPEVDASRPAVRWPDRIGSRELTVVGPDGVESTLGPIDIVFPILHGRFGEDGTVQGMLELVDLPYVGSGVLASSLGMDKHFTKTVLEAAGIAVAPWVRFSAYEWASAPEQVLSSLGSLGLPAFVKPARAGSSVGVSKVSSPEAFAAAIEVALAEDSTVLVETGLVGREVECAVLESLPGTAPRVSVAGEVVVTGRDFYDFAAKYLDAPGIELVCPADIPDAQLAEMQDLARRSFDALGCAGLARVDFFLTADGFVVNEVNTMPGFTPISMFPSCWLASGLSYPELITELIEVARARS
ncbi:D-alanine--D-alanine ligase [Plantibacter sp. Leaf171]|uniref:D-alanine--D-alanine ligase family protein n=1 Tax=unclassified Plantibacter TaxID=2624265 RepID=UPI0006F4C8ED|nr:MULTISPECIES: D-alanine--D-alanine ligase family protein [unclassified Plantibacter]KQM15458.1 D-alanine--D-alanine ligase [Plantibacter sp. Leaf1]KQR58602.1 D-alanine--D-alanine ligase [Plantibacter sp. Leaf171]